MGRWNSLSALLILALTTSCGSAYADRVAIQPEPGPVAPVVAESPYKIELIGEDGRVMPVFQQNGRFYIQGAVGQRYTIRVSNPTARRIEAVLSVDGLDVIDGKTADYRGKRGYVVPPYGELRVDGWRTSTTSVAAFRFSSVSNSYAGRKGEARNVGVVGVAIFEERAAPEIIVQTPPPPPYYRERYYDEDYGGDAEEGEAPAKKDMAPPADKPRFDPAPEPTGGTDSRRGGGGYGGAPPRVTTGEVAPRAPMPPPDLDGRCGGRCGPPQEHRPGLGTEYGEQRYSAVTWTRFERANPIVPSATAEFRYNDAGGLAALGIRTGTPVTQQEIDTRETANPFPGYAEPPRW